MKSWKTTLTGVLTIIAGLTSGGLLVMKGQVEAGIGTAITAITAGIGLINAKDNNVTGGTVTQPSSTPK